MNMFVTCNPFLFGMIFLYKYDKSKCLIVYCVNFLMDIHLGSEEVY